MKKKYERFLTDTGFDALYSAAVKKHSFIHWTPFEIIETTIDWLQLNENSRVLDIGSGAGKFCAIGSMLSQAHFTGVEKRSDLFDTAQKLCEELKLTNVNFINEDIVNIPFEAFSAFYYYNPFCEYIAEFDRIDDTISYDPDTFRVYEDYVIDQLDLLPVRTRVVTYCSGTFPLPASYEMRDLLYDGKLALWVKTK